MSENAQAALPCSEIAPVPMAGPAPNDAGASELQTRRRAAAVLEVLGGAKSPPEAAEGLGIALPSYYLLEARALQGLVSACEPKPRGRAAGEGKTFQTLKRENERLRHDLTRSQALTRAVQRAAGMQAPQEAPAADRTVRRRRRATSRALRAARELVPAIDSPRPSLPTSPLAVEPQP